MDGTNAGAESEGGLLVETLPRSLRAGLIIDYTRRQRLGPERNVIPEPEGGADQCDFTAKSLRRDIKGIGGNETTRGDERALAQIERLGETKRVDQVGRIAQPARPNLRGRDLDVTDGKDGADFVMLRYLAG